MNEEMNELVLRNQKYAILAHLWGGHRLTSMDALRLFGTSRLAARVLELKTEGQDIRKKMVSKNGKRFAEYWLEGSQSRKASN